MYIPFIITALILFSSTFVGIRAALVDYSPIEIAVLRFFISSIILLIIAVPGKIRLPDSHDWLSFISMGVVLFINMISLNYGMQTITAGEANLVVSTSQLFQVLIAWIFLNEAISTRFFVGLIFCFLGVTIIALHNSKGFTFNMGVIFVVVAAVTNAIYFTAQKPLLKKYSALNVISYAFWIATLLLIPFGHGLIGTISIASIDSTFAVVFIGIASLVANVFWSKALSKIKASRAAVYLYIIPVMTIIIGYLYLHELPSLISCIGGIVILVGVFISNVGEKDIEQSL